MAWPEEAARMRSATAQQGYSEAWHGGGGSGEMTSDFEAQGGIEYKAFFPALPRPVSVSQTSSRPTCSVYFKTRKCTSLLSGLELFLLALLVSCLSVCTYSSKVAFYGRVEISLRY